MDDALKRLAQLRGLGEAYYDYRGTLHYFSDESRRAILQAMQVPVGSEQAMVKALAQQESFGTEALRDATLVPCFQPEMLNNQRRWGISIQLYTVRSENNWGMGDFADLYELIRLAAPLGCDLIGINPLHALFPAEPAHCSPYSPSSRLFLNVLYIAVHELEAFKTNPAIRDWFASDAVQSELQALRASSLVQYTRVAALKLYALRQLYAAWQRNKENKSDYLTFVAERGELLRLHAVFDALDQHFRTQTPSLHGWQQWPAEFRDPTSHAVSEFIASHQADIEFYLYLQWLAATQLQQAQHTAKECGMSIGLYGDLAVGANPDGSEVWSNQSLYITQATVGAPPDPMALNGQDWGIPPMDPMAIKAQSYKPIIELLRANMRSVGALRIDHVMSLFRLWWVPRGFVSTHGVYVHYPLEAMCSVLADESNQHQCLIVGEDLGVVPDEIRKAMAERHLYHYKVLLFEKEGAHFRMPQEYLQRSVATVTTHDLPPLKAWWQSDDLTLREQLKLYAPDLAQQLRHERDADRRGLLVALTQAQLWSGSGDDPLPPYSFDLAQAVYQYLAMSSSALVLVQLEDLIGMTTPVNVPGTYIEHANWQRKLTMTLEGIFALESAQKILGAVQKARR